MTPELPEVFNFTNIPYTLNTHPRGRNIISLCSVTSHFPDTRLSKIGNARKGLQNDLNHLSVKSTLFTLNTHPEAQILLILALQQAVFELQTCRKSEMHQMTPE